MTPHTPATGEGWTVGPWEVNPFAAQVDCQKLSRKGGLLPIAKLLWPTDEVSEKRTFANARLIAAAPDLYNALSLLDQHGHTDAVWRQARAALAKARGQ